MATIALSAGKLNMMPGLILDLKKVIYDYKTELFSLSQKTKAVDRSICDLEDVASEIKAATELMEGRVEKLEQFRSKVEDFIELTVDTDQDAAETVNQNKDDFYDKYDYLKPDCEKSGWEKFCERVEAAADWCKEHWVAIVTAIVVIVIAIVAAVFLGPAAIAAICSAIAFFCCTGDLVSTLITGKDLYNLLKDSGFPVLAEIFAGIEWGATIASIGLSLVQLGGQIAKVGLKNFLTGGQKGLGNILKHHAKTLFNGLKADWNSIFGSGLKFGDRCKALWNIVVLNQSGDFNFKQSILDYRNGEKVITAVTNVGFDDNHNVVIKSDSAAQALEGNVGDRVATKKSSIMFDNTMDYDWANYGGTKYGEPVDIMKMYSEGKIPYNLDGTVNTKVLRRNIWNEAKVPSGGLSGGKTAHEMYEIIGGKVTVISVDQVIHGPSVFLHNGGVSHAAAILNSINSHTFALNEIMAVLRRGFSIPPLFIDSGATP